MTIYDAEDRAGWDKKAEEDQLEVWQGRGTAKAGAISRHQECLSWTAAFVDERRPLTLTMTKVLWKWAFCRANGWDFGASCVKIGWARPTAYRRLTAIVEQITDNLNNVRTLLREPDARWVRQEQPLDVQRSGWLKNCDTSQAIKFTPSFRTEKSRDLIQTQEDAETFAKFLERRNARLRKLNAWRDEKVAS
jgi:hypothetical protein